VSGNDTSGGCQISGNVSVPSARYNGYELAMTWICNDGTHNYKGVGLYEPITVTIPNTVYSTPQSLVMEYDDGATSAVVVAAVRVPANAAEH
jgi:hypothetical protein